MAAVARLNPKDVFTAEEWARLSQRSNWRGWALVAHAWALVLGAGAMVVIWPNPVTYLLAVAVIGARQLGLAILMHDAAHGALHPNAKVNDLIGTWLCAAPVGGSLLRYRPYHLGHHKFTEQPEDPDIGLSRPFPITRAALMRKVVRDLTGQTFYRQQIAPFLAGLAGQKRKPPRIADPVALRFWMVNGAAILAFAAVGLWWVWPALWIVPMATWQQLVTRLRNIGEHACVAPKGAETAQDPFLHARTTLANPLERLFIAPYWVHFHAEHHLFMHLPCWKLPEAHRMLVAKGYGDRLRVARGYREVFDLAAPAAA